MLLAGQEIHLARLEREVSLVEHEARLGETCSHGSVVLHESAHQLDRQDGVSDGTSLLPSRSRYVSWARVLGAAYTELVDRIHENRPAVLDAYGATSPAEFFAVTTECFFEKPGSLEQRHPALYAELRRFHRRDPAAIERGEAERE